MMEVLARAVWMHAVAAFQESRLFSVIRLPPNILGMLHGRTPIQDFLDRVIQIRESYVLQGW
jgi:hypothetical protein